LEIALIIYFNILGVRQNNFHVRITAEFRVNIVMDFDEGFMFDWGESSCVQSRAVFGGLLDMEVLDSAMS